MILAHSNNTRRARTLALLVRKKLNSLADKRAPLGVPEGTSDDRDQIHK
jgi:hypothetical protein